MPLFVDTNKIKKVFSDTTAIKKVWIDTNLVHSDGKDPLIYDYNRDAGGVMYSAVAPDYDIFDYFGTVTISFNEVAPPNYPAFSVVVDAPGGYIEKYGVMIGVSTNYIEVYEPGLGIASIVGSNPL